MLKLNLNFDKKDIEIEINGKIYGFNVSQEKMKEIAGLSEMAKKLNSENEEEVLAAVEDAIDMIYGEGTIDSIFEDHDTTRATLLELLQVTIQALKNYGSQFGETLHQSKTEDENNIMSLNRAQRRAKRHKK